MKKFVCYILSTVLTLSAMSVRASDDPRDGARSHIKQTMRDAQTYAQNLVSSDFSAALMDALSEGFKVAKPNPVFTSYTSDVAALEAKVQSLILASNQNQGQPLSGESIVKIWEEYKNAVRKRFEISFQAQEAYYDQSLFIGAAQNAVARFKNVCETGRSQKGVTFQNQYLPNLPPVNYDFYVQYESGNGGGLTKVNSQSSNSTGKDKDRQTTGAVINTAATVSLSVAATGGTGSMVAACAVAAPYLAAAAVAYAVIAGALSADEQRRAQDRIAEANVMRFRDTASDADVSRYYRETCQNIMPLISKVQNKLQDIKSDSESRNAAIKAAQLLQPDLEKFEALDANAQKNVKYITLYRDAMAGECKAKIEMEKNPTCFKGTTHYNLASDEKIQLPINEKEMKSIMDPIEASLQQFGKDYPKERRAELISAKLVLVLAPNWEKTNRELSNLSFDTIDSSMASLFQKIQVLFALLRADQDAIWNKKNTELSEELAAVSQFEALRATHRKLVNEGVKVIFNRTSRDEFQKNVASYLQEARAFNRLYSSHKPVKSYMTGVEFLARNYKSL